MGLWISGPAVFYTLVHVLRCFAFAASAVFLEDYLVLQVFALTLPTLFMLFVVLANRHHLWRDKVIFIQHVGNEATIYLCSVTLYYLSL